MTFAENDDVITEDGRSGTVSYLKGDSARVVFPDGTKKTIRLSKLRKATKARSPVGPRLVLDDGTILTQTPIMRVQTLDEIAAAHGLVRASMLSDARVTRPIPKEKPWRSRAYLEYVRSHPCCMCGAREGIQASHHGMHGTGSKPDDTRAVPLCAECHIGEFHQHGTLPGMTRDETDALVERVAFELLVAFLLRRGLVLESLRALTGMLRERSAA